MISLNVLAKAASSVAEYKVYVISAAAIIALISSVWVRCDNEKTNRLLGTSTGEVIQAQETLEVLDSAAKKIKIPTKKEVVDTNKPKNAKEQDNDSATF